MKRTGFLAAITGALAAAAMPLPMLPQAAPLPDLVFNGVPLLVDQLPPMLAYSSEVTRDLMVWNTYNLAFRVPVGSGGA